MSSYSARTPLVIGAMLLSASACGTVRRSDPRSAEERVLEHQIRALEALARSGEREEGDDDVVVGVEGRLIQETLNAATPWSGEVAGRFVVEVQRAHVSLDGGVALVRLSGTARSRTDSEGEARLSLYAGIDSAVVDPRSRMLSANVSLIAFEATAEKGGEAGSASDSLVEALGGLGLDAYARLLSAVAVPVSIEQHVELPELGPRPVGVPAMDFPASLAATGVWAFRERLWITLDGQVRPEAARP